MAVRPTIPSAADIASCGPRPYYTIWTPNITPLYLWVLPAEPRRYTTWRTHRGLRHRIYYGARPLIQWCLPQLEPEDSLQHTWALPDNPAGTLVYLVIATRCGTGIGGAYSPPIPYLYTACGPNPGYVTATGGGNTILATGTHRCIIGIYESGDPAMHSPTPSGWVQTLAAGAATCRMYSGLATYSGSTNAPSAGNVCIHDATTDTHLYRAHISIPYIGPPAPIARAWSGTLAQPTDIQLRWEPDAGNPPNTLIWDGPAGTYAVLRAGL